MEPKKLIDITRKIRTGITVWPGDDNVEIENKASIDRGDESNIHSIRTGLHTATHIDSPLHFIRNGASIDRIELVRFCGRCRVFDSTGKKYISADDISGLNIEKDDAVLFKTDNSRLTLEMPFECEFVYVDASAAEYLAEKGIKALGIDYLSIDKYRSPGHKAHHILLQKGIILIEGLDLSLADEGEYFITYFPLKIEGAEASPVRAVLMRF
jgi:arylformamidase